MDQQSPILLQFFFKYGDDFGKVARGAMEGAGIDPLSADWEVVGCVWDPVDRSNPMGMHHVRLLLQRVAKK